MESEPGYQPYVVDSRSVSVDSRLLQDKVETDCRTAPRLVGSPYGKNKRFHRPSYSPSAVGWNPISRLLPGTKKEQVIEKLPLTLDSTDLQSYCHQLMDEFRENRAYSTGALSLEFCYKEAA
jgi:hypothetical protein